MSKNVKTFSEAYRNGIDKAVKNEKGVIFEKDETLMEEVKKCLLSGDVSRIEWYEDHCMFTLRYESNEHGINYVAARFDTVTALKILYRIPIIPFKFFIEECDEKEFPNIWKSHKEGGEA
jgi:hypothetical protein